MNENKLTFCLGKHEVLDQAEQLGCGGVLGV